MVEAIIQTNNLTKVFKDFWHRPRAKAVQGLTFSVNRGEVYGLLGPNGSGKSTTIKMILGLLFPTNGQVTVFGRGTTDTQIKKRIGFLPEDSYLYKHLNAEETLDFFGRLFNLSSAERKSRTESLLRLSGLMGAKKRPIGEYSKGMARRIGIAQALINDPELIILDEPTTGLDPIGTRDIKDLILKLRDKGKTILLCSHLLADVEDICDRVGILYGGTMQTEGMTQELLCQEEMTQITAPMDDRVKGEICHVLQKAYGVNVPIAIGPPVERLERLFLRVIEKARLNQDTSGVAATEKTMDFFSSIDSKPVNILESLLQPVAGKEMRATTTYVRPESEAPGINRDLLNALLVNPCDISPPPNKEADSKEAYTAPLTHTENPLLSRLIVDPAKDS